MSGNQCAAALRTPSAPASGPFGPCSYAQSSASLGESAHQALYTYRTGRSGCLGRRPLQRLMRIAQSRKDSDGSQVGPSVSGSPA